MQQVQLQRDLDECSRGHGTQAPMLTEACVDQTEWLYVFEKGEGVLCVCVCSSGRCFSLVWMGGDSRYLCVCNHQCVCFCASHTAGLRKGMSGLDKSETPPNVNLHMLPFTPIHPYRSACHVVHITANAVPSINSTGFSMFITSLA